jgi:hypothetical protein
MNRLNKNSKFEKNEEEIYRLSDIQAEEVSIVTRGANKRKFVIVKNDNQKTLIEQFNKAQEGDMESLKAIVAELFKNISDETLKDMGLQKIETQDETDENDENVDKNDKGESEEEEVNKSEETSEIKTLREQMEKMQKQVAKYERTLKANEAESQTDVDPLDKSDSADHSYQSLGLSPLHE